MCTIVVGGINSTGTPALKSSEYLCDDDQTSWKFGPETPIPITASQMVDHPAGGCVLVGGNNPSPSTVLSKLLWLQDLSQQWQNLNQTLQTARFGHVALSMDCSYFNC
jgi:hypothetical protein